MRRSRAEYGSVMEYQGAKLSARNTFLIDPQGKIVRVFVKVKPAGHSEEVLAALAELTEEVATSEPAGFAGQSNFLDQAPGPGSPKKSAPRKRGADISGVRTVSSS